MYCTVLNRPDEKLQTEVENVASADMVERSFDICSEDLENCL